MLTTTPVVLGEDASTPPSLSSASAMLSPLGERPVAAPSANADAGAPSTENEWL